MHKENVVSASFEDTLRTLVISGRPLRVRMNEYVDGWEKKPEEIKRLTEQGIVPMAHDLDEGRDVDMPFLMGQVAAIIDDVKPAREIVQEMVKEACDALQLGQSYMTADSKL